MNQINESEVPLEERASPKGVYEIHRRHLSLALGGKKDQGAWNGGHPFDVELAMMPPGKKNYPLHSHAAQWEYYIILSGTGTVHESETRSHPVQSGDHLLFPPGEAHQLENTGEVDLVFYVIADHHPADVTSYPRTGKRHLKPEFRVVECTEADYYDGEE